MNAASWISLPDEHAASVAWYKRMYDRVSALGKIGVWECSLPEEQLIWTETVYDLFEITPGAPISRGAILPMYEPESRARLERVRDEAIRRGTGFSLDAQIRTARGNRRWIRIIADIDFVDGKPVSVFGTKQDVTNERQAHEEIRWLQTELIHVSRVNAMSAMASTLAHELNQPLTAIANYLAVARRLSAQDTDGELARAVDDAHASAQRAGQIIRRLREMTVRGEARRELFELKQAIEEAVALATAGRPDLHVSWDVEPRIDLLGDRIQIQQVLMNLIQNSYEAADGADCEIRIDAVERDDAVEVCVRDNGPGIADDILPHIFDSLVTTKSGGMGIGLSVSRTIIEMHRGHITVSNNEGPGASICIVLPKYFDAED